MSETSAVTLTEFITARLDERVREIAELRELADSIGRVYGSPAPPEDDMRLGDIAYFALHAEADRVLREVKAMRRIVAEYDPRLWFVAEVAEAAGEAWEHVTDDVRLLARRAYLVHRDILRALASIWADHSDYNREEWA